MPDVLIVSNQRAKGTQSDYMNFMEILVVFMGRCNYLGSIQGVILSRHF
jgi:hypothetical protein